MRDYQSALQRWENATRSYLRLKFEEMPHRILRWRDMRNEILYRELDFVHGLGGTPKFIAELKHRESFTSDNTGPKQVRAALKIARKRWSELNGFCLNVFMAPVLKLDDVSKPALISLDQLGTNVPSCFESSNQISQFWMCSEEVSDYALSSSLLSKREIEELPRLRMLANDPLALFCNDDDAFEHNTLGAIWPNN